MPSIPYFSVGYAPRTVHAVFSELTFEQKVMSHTITIITNDQQSIQFECDDKQNIQDAAEAAGHFPPAICKSGGCGSCMAHCESGDYQLADYSAGILPENPEETQSILLCRTFPQGDLVINAPYAADKIQTHQPGAREATIVELEVLAERTVKLSLQLIADEENGLSFAFEPGQFVELEIPELNLKRAYSLANTPNWEGKLEFLIRLQENGVFSNYLKHHAKTGDNIKVHGPAGTFTLQEQSINPLCFVSGGTGLAPFMSILRRMEEWGEDHPVQLFLGVNNEQEIFCHQELKDLQDKLPQLNVNICVWQASENWSDYHGTPVDALAQYLQQTQIQPDIYLCGPPPLVESATQVAIQHGVDADKIYCERFA